MSEGQPLLKSGSVGETIVKTAAAPLAANCVSVCAPSKDMLRPGAYAVNDINKMEAITQPIYSYQAYPAAGSTSLVFFQNPASGTVTREDTNMELAGQIPAPQKFLIQGIGIDYSPGLAPVTLGAASANSQTNDMYAIMRRGLFNLIIGSKTYATFAPLKFAPTRSWVRGDFGASNATTPAAALATKLDVARVEGDVWKPTPLLLEAGQNFRVELTWPGGAVPIPSADAAARIGVILYGTLYRPPQ